MTTESAVIVGVGPGLGWSLVERFTAADFDVAAAARRKAKLEEYKELDGIAKVTCFACDASIEDNVHALFDSVLADQGIPDIVVFNAGNLVIGEVTETATEDFVHSWRVGCLAGFFVGRAAAQAMLERGSGTIIFTGATAALRGGARFASLAVPKVGLRALSQSMARELGPKGIHVAHVIIDGGIPSKRPRNPNRKRRFPKSDIPDSVMQPAAIAEQYYQLHRQPRSAWTQELDLRPWVEKF